MAVSKTVDGSSILSAPAKNDQRKMSKFGNYVKDSYEELVHKVSWPTFKELQSSAVVVAVAAVILSLIIFVMDWVCGINPGGFKGILGFIYALIG